MLVGHVPPGQFEKHSNTYWFRPFFNDVFLQLLRKHADVIASAHFAHHHSDTFKVIYDQTSGQLTKTYLFFYSPWKRRPRRVHLFVF